MASTGVAAIGRAARRRVNALRELPVYGPMKAAPDGRFSVVVTAAFTSACVSVLTIWLLGQGGPAGTEPLAAASPGPPAEMSPPHTIASAPHTATPNGATTTPAPTEVHAEPVRRAAFVPPEPEPSPAPQAATAGEASRLVIVTEPRGARVTINGVGWGSTPVTVRHLPPGTKRIRFTRPGYLAEERIVNMDDGRAPGTLRIALKKAPVAGVR